MWSTVVMERFVEERLAEARAAAAQRALLSSLRPAGAGWSSRLVQLGRRVFHPVRKRVPASSAGERIRAASRLTGGKSGTRGEKAA